MQTNKTSAMLLAKGFNVVSRVCIGICVAFLTEDFLETELRTGIGSIMAVAFCFKDHISD